MSRVVVILTKSYNRKYGFWVAGYYDDFNGARQIPQDTNTFDTTSTYSHTNTHYGNPLSKQAVLNPRYALSYPDRARVGDRNDTNQAVTALEGLSFFIWSSTNDRYLRNRGLWEWLTHDEHRTNSQHWEGRAQLQVPDWKDANKYDFGYAQLSYMAFGNGHNTQGVYSVPLGVDASYGRDFFVAWDALDSTNLDVSPFAGCPKQYSDGSENFQKLVQCNITSVLMGFKNPGGNARTDAGSTSLWAVDLAYVKQALYPLKSPSGMPFLVHDYVAVATGTQRIINYDSLLKCKGIGDVFSIRMSHHAQGNFTASNDPTYSLKVGFISTATYNHTTAAWDEATPCVTCDFTPTDIGLNGGLIQWDGDTERPGIDESNLWKDIEIIFDFTAQTWKAYLDGADYNTPFKSGSMGSRPGGGSWVASDLKGWALDVTVASLGSDAYAAITTCIDRAALYFPLTNPTTDVNTFTDISTNAMLGFDKTMKSNTISQLTLKLEDDANSRLLLPLVTEVGLTDWSLIMFRDNEDRPIWRGPIEKIDIKQDTISQTTEFTLTASDSLSLLDRQLPLWEYGQNATTSMGDFTAMESSVNTQIDHVQSIREKLMMGATKLKLTDKGLAFDDNSSFRELDDSRAILHSGHPIQMYVDEDREGPNDTELEWLGRSDNQSDTGSLSEILFIHHVKNGGDRVLVAVPSTCSLQASDAVTISGCGNDLDGTYTIQNVVEYSGSDFYFDGNSTEGYPATSGIDITPFDVCNNRDHEAQSIAFKVMDMNPGASASLTPAQDAITTYATRFDREDVGGFKYQTQKQWLCTTTSSHGLEIGDEVIFGDEVTVTSGGTQNTWSTSVNNLTFNGLTVRVVGVPSTTTFQFVLSRYFSGSSGVSDFGYGSTPITFSSGKGLPVLRMDKFGHPDANRRNPNHAPLIFKTALLTDSNFLRIRYRNLHARWMKDLTSSLWFKARFGIISNKCWWRTGAGTWLKNPVQSALQSTYTTAGKSLTASWDGLNADYAAGTTSITLDEPGIWYWLKVRGKDGILDFVDTETGERDVVLATVASNPSSATCTVRNTSSAAPTGWSGTFTQCFEGPSGLSLWDIVVHCEFEDLTCNGVFQIVDIVSTSGGVTKYNGIKIMEFGRPDTSIPTAYAHTQPYLEGVDKDGIMPLCEMIVDGNVNVPSTFRNVWTPRVGGCTWNNAAVIPYNSVRAKISGALPANGSTGKVYYGTFNLNVKGLTRTWDDAKTQITLRKIDNAYLDEVTMGYNKNSESLTDTRGAYKHLYVLWADMRNNGEADADGGFRKNTFGLITPTPDNYKLEVLNTGQLDESGNYVKWGELKAGEDFDLWEFNSQSEPFSGGDWSAVEGGSNTYPFTEFRNWDETGGAFVIVDLSRYYNLNTMANNGRAGYRAGGLAAFEDYGDFAISATPYLTGAYWKEAVATIGNAGTLVDEHENQFNFFNDATPIVASITSGDTSVSVVDVTKFSFASGGAPGYGTVLCKKGNDQTFYNIRWTGVTASTNTLTGVLIMPYPNAHSPAAVRTALEADATAGLTGSQVDIDITSESGFDEVLIYNTPAALVALKVQMYLNGFIRNPNSGTFYESSKVRFLQTLAHVDSWTRSHFLSTITDIANTPITRNMTLTQTDYDADHLGSGLGDTDSFGSIIDCTTSTTLEVIRKIQSSGGTGEGGNRLPFFWGIGRDNRFEIRPTYSINHTFTRDNVKSSSLSSNMSGNVTNVRVFFNGNTSFVDFPDTNTIPAASRWKILEYPDVTLKQEAEALAKKEYSRVQKGNLTITTELIRSGTTATLNPLTNHVMLGGARYGYIADTYVKTLAQDSANTPHDNFKLFGIPGMCSWSSRWGGTPVSRGIVNATQGAPDPRLLGPEFSTTATYNSVSCRLKGLTPSNRQDTVAASYPAITDEIPNGLLTLGTVSGNNFGAHRLMVGGPTATRGFLQVEKGGGGTANYVVAVHRTTSGSSVEDYQPASGTTAASAGDAWITNGLDTTSSGSDDVFYTNFIDVSELPGTDGKYTMYISYVDLLPPSNLDKYNGVNSVTNAVQVVHIPKDTPYVSAATGEEMRVAVAINNLSGEFSSIDDVLFDVIFLDYSYASTTGSLPSTDSGTYSPTRTPTLNAFSKVTVKGNGFYEVAFPANYGATAGAKMVVSVNTDYLRGILRNRLGLATDVTPPTGGVSSVLKNSNGIPGVSSGTIHYTSLDSTYISPFPLGVYDCFNNFGPAHNKSYMAAYTAPRVHIVDDMNWMPATKVTYTDANLDIFSQEMTIESVKWSQKGRDHESVVLTLQKDAEQYNYDFVRMFGIGGRPTTPNTPTQPKPKPFPPANPFNDAQRNRQKNPKGFGEERDEGNPRPSFTNMGSPETVPNEGTSMNDLSRGIARSISGIMEVPSDHGAINSSWGIPGQKRPGRTTTADLSIDGFDTMPEASNGNSVVTTDGFALPGISDFETGANGEYHSHTMKVRVPEGAVTNMIGIDAQVSLGTHTGSGYITTTVTCVETEATVTRKIAIGHGTTRTLKNLLPMTPLSGAETAGNTLEIKFERTPGDGTDTTLYAALIVHNVSLKTRRGTNAQQSSTDRAFRPY